MRGLYTDGGPEWDIDADAATVSDSIAAWTREKAAADERIATHSTLDSIGAGNDRSLLGGAVMPRAAHPDPTVVHPMPDQSRVVLLKPAHHSPLIEVGEFTYYDDPAHATAFETRNVLYHYGPEKLVIGRFCAFAEGVKFIMNGANHRMDGPSTFPFPIMGAPWAEHFDLITGLPGRGDTVVGNDVWLGHQVMVMPGVRIGNGAIVASGSVVVENVPDYGIVGGNPARLIRHRYGDRDVDRLLKLAWWDWPLAHITSHLRTIMSGSIDDLENAARAS